MSQNNFPFFKTWSNQNKDHFIEMTEIHCPQSFKINNKQLIYDLSSISFQASFGLKNQTIESSILRQIPTQAIAFPSFYTDKQLKISHKLKELMGLEGRLFYTAGGAEAIENALKVVRHISQKKVILSRKKSYHGATLGALNITGDWRREGHILPDNFHDWIPEPDEDPHFLKSCQIIEQIGPEKIAGICIETITGKNGVIIPPNSWWEGISKATQKYNIKLILDEIICGFYRTSKPFGYQNFNIKPDVVCLGKAITGGMAPMGAILLSTDLSDYYDKNIFSAGLTNYAHPLGLSALEGVLEFTNKPVFCKLLNKNSNVLDQFLKRIIKQINVNSVRNIGMLAAIDLGKNISYKHFLSKGLHLAVNHNTVVLAPALNYDTKTLENCLRNLEKIIQELP